MHTHTHTNIYIMTMYVILLIINLLLLQYQQQKHTFLFTLTKDHKNPTDINNNIIARSFYLTKSTVKYLLSYLIKEKYQ